MIYSERYIKDLRQRRGKKTRGHVWGPISWAAHRIVYRSKLICQLPLGHRLRPYSSGLTPGRLRHATNIALNCYADESYRDEFY
jgi:hypothetical protein